MAAVLVRCGFDAYKYVDPYFYASTFRACYSYPIHHVPEIEIVETIEMSTPEVIPPLTKKQAGRPKRKRFVRRMTGKRMMTCSRCGKKEGHNRKSCNEDFSS